MRATIEMTCPDCGARSPVPVESVTLLATTPDADAVFALHWLCGPRVQVETVTSRTDLTIVAASGVTVTDQARTALAAAGLGYRRASPTAPPATATFRSRLRSLRRPA